MAALEPISLGPRRAQQQLLVLWNGRSHNLLVSLFRGPVATAKTLPEQMSSDLAAGCPASANPAPRRDLSQ